MKRQSVRLIGYSSIEVNIGIGSGMFIDVSILISFGLFVLEGEDEEEAAIGFSSSLIGCFFLRMGLE